MIIYMDSPLFIMLTIYFFKYFLHLYAFICGKMEEGRSVALFTLAWVFNVAYRVMR